MNIDEIRAAVADMHSAFDEIQMPRTPFMLQHFVVGSQDTEPQRYHQCVLELQIKYDAICLLYTSPSPRDGLLSRMPSSA